MKIKAHFGGILPKGSYPPYLRMADRALLAGYHRLVRYSVQPEPLKIAKAETLRSFFHSDFSRSCGCGEYLMWCV